MELSTPLLADACIRLNLPLRIAPSGVRPVIPGSRVAGRALPVRHHGSVDIFLEAMGTAQHGDLLIVDNEGRSDEGCVGDLTILEARASGLAGVIVWGCHRDTEEIVQIEFPVFSYGTFPAGPRETRKRKPEALLNARFGDFVVTGQDMVYADADGVLFVPASQADKIVSTAKSIFEAERRQANDIRGGKKLRDQLQFDDYLKKRSADQQYTFRQHLRKIGGAIEE